MPEVVVTAVPQDDRAYTSTLFLAARSHASLEGLTPRAVAREAAVPRANLNKVRWVSHCRGLVQLPVAA